MPKPDLALYKQIFEKFDADKSGSVDINEMEAALKKLGLALSAAQIKGMITLMDKDANSTLDFTEFAQFFYTCEQADLKNNSDILFFAADSDYSGDIDKEEFVKILVKINVKPTPQQLEAMMKQVADAGKGTISHENFVKFMKQLTGK